MESNERKLKWGGGGERMKLLEAVKTHFTICYIRLRAFILRGSLHSISEM